MPLRPSAKTLSGTGNFRSIPLFKMELLGVNEAIKQMEGLKDSIVKQVVMATAAELERLLSRAKQYAPEDTGRLKDSGRVFKPRVSGGGKFVSFQIVFGGKTVVARRPSRFGNDPGGPRFVDYAVIVHEDHPSHSHFLDKAAAEFLPGMSERISKKVKVQV